MDIVLVQEIDFEPVVERFGDVHHDFLFARLQVADAVLRKYEFFDELALAVARHIPCDLFRVDVPYGGIGADVADGKPRLPCEEAHERLILVAVLVLHGLFAEVALLESRLRVFRVDAARRVRTPADEKRRCILCTRVRRHALDHLIARRVLLAADDGIAHGKPVEGVEVIVCVAVEDVRRDGIGEAADEGSVFAPSELFAVRRERDFFDVHTRAIF